MPSILNLTGIAQIISLVSFLYYGLSCLTSKKMELEFNRYRLAHFRPLTGYLQILGGLGLFAGFYFRPLTLVSSLGLATLMLMGVGVRLRIRDPLYAIAPAFIYFGLNLYIFLNFV